MEHAICIQMYNWREMAYGGLPFPGTYYHIPAVGNIYLSWNG